MPRAKKTTEDAVPKVAVMPKITKTKGKSVSKTTKTKDKVTSKPAPSTSSAASKLSSIEKRLKETEDKLEALITIMHNDFNRGQLQGPEGLASKLRRAGLLS